IREPLGERREHLVDELLRVRELLRDRRTALDPPRHVGREDVGDRRSSRPPGVERGCDGVPVVILSCLHGLGSFLLGRSPGRSTVLPLPADCLWSYRKTTAGYPAGCAQMLCRESTESLEIAPRRFARPRGSEHTRDDRHTMGTRRETRRDPLGSDATDCQDRERCARRYLAEAVDAHTLAGLRTRR